MPLHRGARGNAIPGAKLLLPMEAALPTLAIVAVVLLSNRDAMPEGLDGFLALRVTVKNILLGPAFIAGCVFILRACRLYEFRAVNSRWTEAARLVLACSLCTALAAVFPLTSRSGGIGLSQLAYVWLGVLAAEIGVRGIRRATARRHRMGVPTRVIVVGTGPRARRVWEEFTSDAPTAYELVGFVDAQPGAGAVPEVEHRRLGTIDDLEQMLMMETIDEVFIALPFRSHYRDCQRAIEICERVGVRTKYRADIFTTSLAWARLEAGLNWVVTMNVAPDDYRLWLKRALDTVGALVGLALLSLVMLAAAVAIKLTSPGPVLFTQVRYGLNKRPFRMLKFRTMVADAPALQETLEARNEADGPVFKISNDPRITPVGRFLRRTSIDELPQLFNVLKGEMSLVGPRPLPPRDVRRFTRGGDMRRFSVVPGLTGLWQISGRSQLGFNDWIRLDLTYIDHWSLIEDIRILLMTIPAVLRGTGAS